MQMNDNEPESKCWTAGGPMAGGPSGSDGLKDNASSQSGEQSGGC